MKILSFGVLKNKVDFLTSYFFICTSLFLMILLGYFQNEGLLSILFVSTFLYFLLAVIFLLQSLAAFYQVYLKWSVRDRFYDKKLFKKYDIIADKLAIFVQYVFPYFFLAIFSFIFFITMTISLISAFVQ